MLLALKKDPNATGTYKLLGDSLRKHPENLIYNLNQDILKEKMMSGSYAIVHVYINQFYHWCKQVIISKCIYR